MYIIYICTYLYIYIIYMSSGTTPILLSLNVTFVNPKPGLKIDS